MNHAHGDGIDRALELEKSFDREVCIHGELTSNICSACDFSNFEFFDGVVRDRIELIQNVLGAKGKEYSRDADRFSNFKTAGRRLNTTPERALLGMREKHEVSILDIISDLDNEKLPTEALLEEKIGDSINYLILLEGLLKERLRNQNVN